MLTFTYLAGRALRQRCKASPAVELESPAAASNEPTRSTRLIETNDAKRIDSTGMAAALTATRGAVYQTFDPQPALYHHSSDADVAIDVKDTKQNSNDIDKQNQQMAALLKTKKIWNQQILQGAAGAAFLEGLCLSFPFMVNACCTTCTCVGLSCCTCCTTCSTVSVTAPIASLYVCVTCYNDFTALQNLNAIFNENSGGIAENSGEIFEETITYNRYDELPTIIIQDAGIDVQLDRSRAGRTAFIGAVLETEGLVENQSIRNERISSALQSISPPVPSPVIGIVTDYLRPDFKSFYQYRIAPHRKGLIAAALKLNPDKQHVADIINSYAEDTVSLSATPKPSLSSMAR